MSSIGMEIYRQCHEHLRDSDKKRDQLIGFYAVVVGLLFAAYEKVGHQQVRVLVAGVVGLVGLFVCLTVISYRKWHILYSRCFQVLQDVNLAADDIPTDAITQSWNGTSRPWYHKFLLLNPLSGTEAPIFDALLVLSFLPWFLAIHSAQLASATASLESAWLFLQGFLAYALLMNALALLIFLYSDSKGPFDHWILRPFRNKEAPAGTSGDVHPMVRYYLVASGVVFLLIAALHVVRLWYAWAVAIAGWPVPTRISWIFLIAGLALATWALAVLYKLRTKLPAGAA